MLYDPKKKKKNITKLGSNVIELNRSFLTLSYCEVLFCSSRLKFLTPYSFEPIYLQYQAFVNL